MLEFIKSIIIEAGRLTLVSGKKITVNKKEGGNFTTEADEASEGYIINHIRRQFPDHKILAEETLSEINNPQSINNLWIVDALDGTTNAKFGIPFFGVSVAYVEKGVVKIGVVYDPNRKILYYSSLGGGSFLNGKKIIIPETQELRGAYINVGCPYSNENYQKIQPVELKLKRKGARLVNLGSAVIEGAYVATGQLSAYYEIGLRPWDVAAIYLIIKEAGGTMVFPFQPEADIFTQKSALMGSRSLIPQILKIIEKES